MESLGKKKIGSTVYHDYLRKALQQLVGMSEKEAKQFSGHSLRRGGATAAAMARVPDQLRRVHGRWVSQRSADGYVGPLPQDAMQLTLAIGL